MTFDLAKILQSKREFRQRAAARPIQEKLALLDALRERALTLRPNNREFSGKHKGPADNGAGANKSE
jgi:hypothetical protein